MTNPRKLDSGERHFLRLIVKDADADGWASVSKQVFPLVVAMPQELVEHEPVGDQGRGRVRLTLAGQEIINAMEWL